MSEKLTKKLNDRISSNETAIGHIEEEIPKQDETINEFTEIVIPIDNEVVSITSQINDLKNQIVVLSQQAYSVGCGTTSGATTIYPDTVQTYSENMTSPSYDGTNPYGGQSNTSLTSSNVGVGTFLVYVQDDSSQSGIGTLYAGISSCYNSLLGCDFVFGQDSTVCTGYASSIAALESQISPLRAQLPNRISDSNAIKTERRYSQTERYGQKRGIASLNERNGEMKSAIEVINRQ